MSEAEFRRWQDFYALEPFGEAAAWHRTAQTCAVLVTALGGVGRMIATAVSGKRIPDGRPARVSDYLPDWMKPPPSAAQDAVRLQLRAVFGDKVKLPGRLNDRAG